MDEITTSFEAALLRDGIDAQVHGREKTLYSIYKKMKTQRKPFADIVDVFGFRIIVSQVEDCYRTLGVAHNLYKPGGGPLQGLRGHIQGEWLSIVAHDR